MAQIRLFTCARWCESTYFAHEGTFSLDTAHICIGPEKTRSVNMWVTQSELSLPVQLRTELPDQTAQICTLITDFSDHIYVEAFLHMTLIINFQSYR